MHDRRGRGVGIQLAGTVADEEGPVKPMPILWYEEMFAERPRLFCGPMTYQKCAHRMGRKKEARREK